MTAVATLVNKFFNKGLLPFQYAQEMLCEFLEECDPAQFDDLISMVVENALVLVSTRPGTKAVCLAAAKGGAKERRRLLKVFKGQTHKLLTHRDAYLAVMMLCEVTDDTVAIQKSLLAELTVVPTAEEIAAAEKFSANPFLDEDIAADAKKSDGDEMDEEDQEEDQEEDEEDEDEQMEEDARGAHMPLLDVALEPSGSKLLLRLLAGVNDDRSKSVEVDSSSKYVDPEELKVLRLPCPASKKNPGVRREELLAFLQEPVLEMVANHAPQLLASRSGSAVVLETLRCFAVASADDGAPEVARAVAAVADAAPVVYEHAIAHRVLKNILLAEAKAGAGSGMLATMLVEKVGADELGAWAAKSNRGAFVVWALLQVPVARSDEALVAGLESKRAAIEAIANVKGASKSGKGGGKGEKLAKGSNGASILLAEISDLLPSSVGQSSASPAETRSSSKAKSAKKKGAAKKKK